MEAKIGFDGKHASHLVRLLRMCREILETGMVSVKRSDREELLSIRNGAWSYDQLLEWSEHEDDALEAVAANSPLPPAPDEQHLDSLCMTLVEESIGR